MRNLRLQAETSHALAIGYDWVHDALTEADRAAIEAGVLRNGILPYLAAIGRPDGNPWARSDWNWNQVVNGGMLTAALAFADADRVADAAATTLGNATAALRLAFGSYGPDGAWPEGAGYWGYGTRYALTAATSLIAATGGDRGLIEHGVGFNVTGTFCIYHMGPAGDAHTVFNWADAEESPCEGSNLLQLGALFPSTAVK